MHANLTFSFSSHFLPLLRPLLPTITTPPPPKNERIKPNTGPVVDHDSLKHTEDAVKSARNARRLRWICFLICVVVVIIIVVVVLVELKPWNNGKKSSSGGGSTTTVTSAAAAVAATSTA
jgi:hypothetical protein